MPPKYTFFARKVDSRLGGSGKSADPSWRCLLLPNPEHDDFEALQADEPKSGEWLPAPGVAAPLDRFLKAKDGSKLRFSFVRLGPEYGDRPKTLVRHDASPSSLVSFAGLDSAPTLREEVEALQPPLRRRRELMLSLIRAFQFEGGLETYAQLGNAQLLAVMSQFVFDCDQEPSPTPAGAQAIQWVGAAGAEVVTDGIAVRIAPSTPPVVKPLRVVPSQSADGVVLSVFGEAHGSDPLTEVTKDAHDAALPLATDELRLVMRWRTDDDEGTEQLFEFLPVLSSLPGAEPTWHPPRLYHPMKPTEGVGHQLRYRVDVVDGFNQVWRTGSAFLLRERLDPPLPPMGGFARMSVGPNGPVELVVGVTVTGLTDEDPDDLWIEIYAEDRPLDETGFYGDDDDLALVELLREADLGDDASDPAAPGFETPQPADDAAPVLEIGTAGPDSRAARERQQRLAGAFERNGLREVERKSLRELLPPPDPSTARKTTASTETVTLRLPATALWSSSPSGAGAGGVRVHAGIVRVDRERRPVCASTLTLCRHELVPAELDAPVEGAILRVFQLEWFGTSAVPSRRALRAGRPGKPGLVLVRPILPISIARDPASETAEEAEEKDEKAAVRAKVEVSWIHPDRSEIASHAVGSAEGAGPVGGYRLWMRDVVAADDPTSFKPMADVQVLSDLAFRYRPLALDGSTLWECAEIEAEHDPRWVFGAAIDAGLSETQVADPDLIQAWLLRARDAIVGGPSGGLDVRVRSPLRPPPSKPPALPDLMPNPTSEPAPPVPPPSWAALAWVLGTLRDHGLTLDLVTRESSLSAMLDTLQRVAEAARTDGSLANVRVIVPCAFDGRPLASFRLCAVPAPGAIRELDRGSALKSDGATESVPPMPTEQEDRKNALEYLRNGPRVILLREADSRPAIRGVGVDRRVTLRCDDAVSDRWHHELEWVVECLDRYDRARALLSKIAAAPTAVKQVATQPPSWDVDPVAPGSSAAWIDALEHATDVAVRTRVVVPRLRRVTETVGVVPVAARPPVRIAFRLLETPERLATAAHALARTRAGQLRVGWKVERALLDRDAYVNDWLPALGDGAAIYAARVTDGILGLDGSGGGTAATGTTPFQVVTGATARTDGEPLEALPAPATDLVELRGAPYYFRYHLHAWLTADAQLGRSSSADQTREPKLLGLPDWPRVVPSVDDGTAGLGQPVRIRLRCPVLGSHLTVAEWEAEQRAPGGLPLLGSAPPIPIHLLPDLRARFSVFLNVGSKEEAKLVQLFEWRRPGPGETATASDPFLHGFSAWQVAPWITIRDAPRGPLGVMLELGSNDQATDDEKEALAAAAEEARSGQASWRLFAGLYRDGLAAPLVPFQAAPPEPVAPVADPPSSAGDSAPSVLPSGPT